jgi:spore photoproduct lyase
MDAYARMENETSLDLFVTIEGGEEKHSRGREMKVHHRCYKTLDGRTKKLVSSVGDGSIIKRFEKTPIPSNPTDVVCPHFLELKWATGCPYACAWCYLQGTFRFLEYKTKPKPKEYSRVQEHLQAFFDGRSGEAELLNSGELADSLMTEESSNPFSRFIMDLFKIQTRHKVLFLTKSTSIDELMLIGNKSQAVISFSINAIPVAKKWEKAPTVEERVRAAGLLADAGYEVRLRLDPMVPVDGWRNAYLETLELVFETLTPSRITLGSLRGLQSTINNARDKSWVTYLEEKSNWGRKIGINTRTDMYRFVIERLNTEFGYRDVALCKETVEVWNRLGLDHSKIRCNCIW